MTEIAEYIGRSIDVLAWRGATRAGEVLLDASLADDESSGEICTGVQKLAQRFLITLMTEVGSIKYKAAAGTNFMTKLRQGRIHNEVDLRAAFQLAEMTARGQLIAEETADDPLDERYRRTELVNVLVTPTYASITLRLYSRAGAASIILPIQVVV